MRKITICSRAAVITCLLITFSVHLTAQWEHIPSPGAESFADMLYTNGSIVGLGVHGIYVSSNDGLTWTNPGSFNFNAYQSQIGTNGANLYLVDGSKGLFVSSNMSQSWTQISTSKPTSPVSLVITDHSIITSSFNQIFRYDKANPSVYSAVYATSLVYPSQLTIKNRGNDLWVSSNDSLLRSSDDGASWQLVHTVSGLKDFDLKGDLILLRANGTIIRSSDYGQTWQAANSYPDGVHFFWSEDYWFILDSSLGIYASSDDGATWNTYNNPLSPYITYFKAVKHGSTILIISNFVGILRSTDNGATWANSNGGLKYQDFSNVSSGPWMFDGGNYLVYNGNYSNDDGQTWFQPIKGGAFLLEYSVGNFIKPFNGGYYFINNYGILFRSDGDFKNWNAISGPYDAGNWYNLLQTTSHLYRVDHSTAAIAISESTDLGLTWFPVGTASPALPVVAHQGYIFQYRLADGLFRSANGGASWEMVGTGLSTLNLANPYQDVPIVSAGNALFAFGHGDIFVSTNDGSSFTRINSNLTTPNGQMIGAARLASDGSAVLIIGDDKAVYYAHDFSGNWINLTGNLPSTGYVAGGVAIHGDYLYYDSNLGQTLWRRSKTVATGEPATVLQPLTVYPVPAIGEIWLDFGIADKGYLEIFSSTGQLVFAQNTMGQSERIDLRSMPAGEYVAKWRSLDSGIGKTGKIIKK